MPGRSHHPVHMMMGFSFLVLGWVLRTLLLEVSRKGRKLRNRLLVENGKDGA